MNANGESERYVVLEQNIKLLKEKIYNVDTFFTSNSISSLIAQNDEKDRKIAELTKQLNVYFVFILSYRTFLKQNM